ncbi:MAG: hypothetical protein IPP40_15480 [bacterium]|nr:hypothetical protein [bacterium]
MGDYWLVKTGPELASPVRNPNEGTAWTYSLLQNYPNPFNTITTIEFVLPMQTEISLTLHNVLGEYITTIAEGAMSAGSHRMNFDAGACHEGVTIIN